VTGLANSPMNQSAFPPLQICSGTRAGSTGAAALRSTACAFPVGAAGYWHYVSQATPGTFSRFVLGSARVSVSLLSLKLARGGS
jgi:hypothetical protein